MNAGRLDRKIAVMSLDAGRDAYGGENMTYTLVKNCFANVKEGSGKESEKDDNLTANQMVTFRIRFTNLISATHIINYDNDNYNIRVIKEVGRRAYLDVITEKRV